MLEDEENSTTALIEDVRSIDAEMGLRVETERQLKEAIADLERKCDEVDATKEAMAAEYAERKKREVIYHSSFGLCLTYRWHVWRGLAVLNHVGPF